MGRIKKGNIMKLRKDNHLAEGEVTGHSHKAMAKTCKVFDDGDNRFLECPDGTEVTHEEHGVRELPAGEYNITIQREINPDTEEIRRVAD